MIQKSVGESELAIPDILVLSTADIVVAAITVLWLLLLLYLLYIVAAVIMTALITWTVAIIDHRHMCRHAPDLRVVGK